MQEEPKQLTGKHVFAMISAFFALIIATDLVLVYKAVSTFGGIDTPDAYRKGLAYNENVAAEQRQMALGWTEKVTFDEKSGALSFTITDARSNPIDNLAVTAKVERAATNRFDRTFPLAAKGAGTYTTDLSQLEAGGWILEFEARAASDSTAPVIYRSKSRLRRSP